MQADHSDIGDLFGWDISLSDIGDTLAVSAYFEASAIAGINASDDSNNDAAASGAAYVFSYQDDNWHQQAYIKSPAPDVLDLFGYALNLSGDGNTLAVGAVNDDGSKSDMTSNTNSNSGAVFIVSKQANQWCHQAYLKPHFSRPDSQFGSSVALTRDGREVFVGAVNESSAGSGLLANPINASAPGSGALYGFKESATAWTQTTYIKASNTDSGDLLGDAKTLSVSADGDALAAGARLGKQRPQPHSKR